MSADERLTDGRDILDTREIVERIAELIATWEESTGESAEDFSLSADDWLAGMSEDDRDELVALIEFRDECADTFADWEYGETLIRDSYFTEYAQELAEDIGAVPRDLAWPMYSIDWDRAARDLRMDYTSCELADVTYWGRS